jgi:hypothetical protein
MGLTAIIGQLQFGAAQYESLKPFERCVEALLQSSCAEGDDGEARDLVGFHFATSAMSLLGVISNRLSDPEQAARSACDVIMIMQEVYDNDRIGDLEKQWQLTALDALVKSGVSPWELTRLPDYPPGPVCRTKRL